MISIKKIKIKIKKMISISKNIVYTRLTQFSNHKPTNL